MIVTLYPSVGTQSADPNPRDTHCIPATWYECLYNDSLYLVVPDPLDVLHDPVHAEGGLQEEVQGPE